MWRRISQRTSLSHMFGCWCANHLDCTGTQPISSSLLQTVDPFQFVDCCDNQWFWKYLRDHKFWHNYRIHQHMVVFLMCQCHHTWHGPVAVMSGSNYSLSSLYTHTHTYTHTHIYIYIYITYSNIRWDLNLSPYLGNHILKRKERLWHNLCISM